MATKKAKKATKKAKPSTGARAVGARATAAAPTQVAMILNGNAVGMVDPAGKTVGQVAKDIAREHGLKTYSILVDGLKILAEDAAKPLTGAKSIEVFAKETRG